MIIWPALVTPLGALTPQPAVAGTTWDSAAKGTNLSLSNADLDATATSGGFSSVRATSGKTTGKKYFEILVVTQTGPGEVFAGVSDDATTSTTTLNNFSYANTAMTRDDGFSGFSGFTANFSTGFGSTVAGKVLGIAVDLDNKKGWIAQDNTWRSSGDPAGGTNEYFTWSGSYTIYPCISVVTSPTSVRLVPSSTTYSPPSGFATWD